MFNCFASNYRMNRGKKMVSVAAGQQKQQNYQFFSNSFPQADGCYALTFNKDSSLLVAGCESGKVRIFEFYQGQLKQTQVLCAHSDRVTSLYFMKLSNQFISGSCDYTICIWSINSSLQWYCEKQIKGHTECIQQVIMNKNEDLIISCSDDQSIKFWVKTNKWECSQTLEGHIGWIFSVCLNECEDLLVSCGFKRKILICYSNCGDCGRKWKKMQIIQVEESGYRVCFIGDSLIAFQPYNGEKMDIFKLNQFTKQFEKSADVKVNNGNIRCYYYFPLQYNKQKSVLLNKNGNTVNLIKRKQNDLFEVEQSIEFRDHSIYGAMTLDGEYLVTWDKISERFIVRKSNESQMQQ